MRLTISHQTHYRYDSAPKSVIEMLRLTPHNTASQSVRDWRIEISGDAPLCRFDDAFGNVNHTFTLAAPGDELSITAAGTVETEPSDGIVSGTRERLPIGVFCRQTALTAPDAAIEDLAEEARRSSDGGPLDRAHKLNGLVHRALRFETGATDVATSASDALAAGHGVCQDLAHVFLAAARACGLPARYVSGYQFSPERARDDHVSHAWAEAHIDGLGWVGFDPSAGLSITDSYVRLAVGLDYLSAAPVRGAIYGGAGETLSVNVTMDRAMWQSQTSGGQSQSQTTQAPIR